MAWKPIMHLRRPLFPAPAVTKSQGKEMPTHAFHRTPTSAVRRWRSVGRSFRLVRRWTTRGGEEEEEEGSVSFVVTASVPFELTRHLPPTPECGVGEGRPPTQSKPRACAPQPPRPGWRSDSRKELSWAIHDLPLQPSIDSCTDAA
ncbi:hypothetical protein BHE74_00023984 [Ensete ventricosum]|nr:hypothetical protein BHE74_00023984 [Ensete ventricosum]